MTPDRDTMSARRYLLGEAADAERERIERAYFADEAMLERMEAAEESLIEDYLADRLSPDSRNRFERECLSRPDRRARIDTIRALMAAAAGANRAAGRRGVPSRMTRPVTWAAPVAAAALVLFAVGAWWEAGVSSGRRASAADAVARSRADAATPLPRPGRTFVVSLSPAGTRSAGTTPQVIVPPGTDIVALRLAAEPGEAAFERGRAIIRTVSGAEVWRGPATSPADRAAGMAASIAVPAAHLGPDDYVITLVAAGPPDADREAARYFLRILAR